MSLDNLHKLIKIVCADGIVSKEEIAQLSVEAAKMNITEAELNFLVQNELSHVRNSMKNNVETESSVGDFSSTTEFKTNPQSNYQLSAFQEVTTIDAQGAMSVVQKAKHQGKWVIIKRIKPEYQNSPQYKELFRREFENAYFLEHPHIVRVYGRGVDIEGEYYFMEYVNGQKLTRLLSDKGIKSGVLIKKIALEILSALDYVHKQQIYHRDLKPDNTLISYNGDNVKLIDFGLSSADAFDEILTHAGTPRYAAPEQQIADTIDQRADIYSFGLIFLEMLVGTDREKIVARKRSETGTQIIEKCTRIDKNERYNSCAEIIEELKNIDIDDLKPILHISKTHIDFGDIEIPKPSEVIVDVKNNGSQENMTWFAETKEPELELVALTETLRIKFTPVRTGKFYGKIKIDGNGGKEFIGIEANVINSDKAIQQRNIITSIIVSLVLILFALVIVLINNSDSSNFEWSSNHSFQGKLNNRERKLEVYDVKKIDETHFEFSYDIIPESEVHIKKAGNFDLNKRRVEFESIGFGEIEKGEVVILKSLSGNQDFEWEFTSVN